MFSRANTASLVERMKAEPSLKLEDVLKDLCESIQISMEALHELQRSTISLCGDDPIRHDGKRFRRALKQEWEMIADTLEEHRSFNSQVQVLHDHIGKISSKECLEFLEEMASLSASLVERFEEHYKDKSLWLPPYDSYFKRDPSRNNDAGSFPVGPGTSTLPSDICKRLSAFSEPDSGFGNDYYQRDPTASPVHAHGLQTSRRFLSAAECIRVAMLHLRDFWLAQNAFIETSRANLKEGRVAIAYEEAKQYAERWSAFDKQTLSAIAGIIRVCDGITVEATDGLYLPKAKANRSTTNIRRLVGMALVMAPIIVDFLRTEAQSPSGLPLAQTAAIKTGGNTRWDEDARSPFTWVDDNIRPPPGPPDFSH
ncbi:hypothetical protein FRC17_009089 [Serendipita sp. 399]|nr:hypothetical protein FRC17_009089 [Serendipita sp. 399]